MPLKDRPRLFGVMPGALMYRVEPSFVVAELDVMRQVRCLALDSTSFPAIPGAQLQVLVESIAQTVGRADYHFQRFRAQRQSLDDIRAWAPGDVFFDAAVSAMHYELQALAGAARLLVDELLFLIARRHGQKADWEAAPLFRSNIISGSPMDKSETHRLRSHCGWFELLNAYRNVFFHRGWTHGSGHFESDGRQAAVRPSMNALLVPDRSCLGKGTRPYEWTYNDRTTVDDVGNGIYQGLIRVVEDLCTNEWGTAVPPPGQLAAHERPNLMVALPIPLTLTIGDCLLAPIFSSRERATAFVDHVPGLSASVTAGDVELIEVRSNPDVSPPTEMLSLSFARLSCDGARSLRVCLDPVPRNEEWTQISASAVQDLPLEELTKDKIGIVSFPVNAPMTAYIWRTPFLIQ